MSSVLSDKQISTGFELQSLVDSHQHPFVVIDRDYQIMAVNKAYEKTYGVGKERQSACRVSRSVMTTKRHAADPAKTAPTSICSSTGSRVPAYTSTTTNTTVCTRCG